MLIEFCLLLILIFPFVGFVILGLGYKGLSKSIGSFIANSFVFIPFILSIIVFSKSLEQPDWSVKFTLFDFIHVNHFQASFTLFADRLTSVFLLVITGVGFLIHLFSVGYMKDDKGVIKYFSYLNLFVFSMLLLVFGSNLLILFIGWEGVGLCSFLLIGFWFQRGSFSYAARKAFVMNRIGDLGLLFAIFWTAKTFGTIEIADIEQSLFDISVSETDATIIALSLFFAATGKSAQIPLFTWLPDAMAGPTPVSALIHAATMVTAGVYLIAKMSFLFELAPMVQSLMTYVALATAFVAATIALVQKDIKKVLAYSTISQLGFMFLALGVGNYSAAVFHVVTHAFFKALLFLGSGSVIHAMGGEQDMTKMGGLRKYLKHTHLTFLIGCLAICGIPGLSGFFSKDLILNSVLQYDIVLWSVAVFTAMLTVFYMFRMYFMVFWGNFRGSKSQKQYLHSSPAIMILPLYILAILSLLGGYINVPEIFHGNSSLSHFLALPIRDNEGGIINISHSTEYLMMGGIFLATLVIIFYNKKKFSLTSIQDKPLSMMSNIVYHSYYMDAMYGRLFVKPIYALGYLMKNLFDNIFDGIVMLFGNMVLLLSRNVRYLQSGYINTYMLWFVLGIIFIFILYLI